MTELTLENGFFKQFDELVRRQLEPVWNSTDAKTKQLVSDLKSLRTVCTHLVCDLSSHVPGGVSIHSPVWTT